VIAVQTGHGELARVAPHVLQRSVIISDEQVAGALHAVRPEPVASHVHPPAVRNAVAQAYIARARSVSGEREHVPIAEAGAAVQRAHRFVVQEVPEDISAADPGVRVPLEHGEVQVEIEPGTQPAAHRPARVQRAPAAVAQRDAAGEIIGGTSRDDIDCAAHGVGAVERRRRALEHLDPIHGLR
jgi:hypothetical protein